MKELSLSQHLSFWSSLILLSHFLFGITACLVLFLVLRLRKIHSPPRLFYTFTFFMMMFPDLDHLYWMRVSSWLIFPLTVWDLFRWSLRTTLNPMTFLHYWVYPFVLLAILGVFLVRGGRTRWIVFGAFLGWTVTL